MTEAFVVAIVVLVAIGAALLTAQRMGSAMAKLDEVNDELEDAAKADAVRDEIARTGNARVRLRKWYRGVLRDSGTDTTERR